jgi:hypothetical protein
LGFIFRKRHSLFTHLIQLLCFWCLRKGSVKQSRKLYTACPTCRLVYHELTIRGQNFTFSSRLESLTANEPHTVGQSFGSLRYFPFFMNLADALQCAQELDNGPRTELVESGLYPRYPRFVILPDKSRPVRWTVVVSKYNCLSRFVICHASNLFPFSILQL